MIKKEILEKIKAYEKIIIHRHVRPDPDALGSQVGLKEIIKQNFPSKEVYAVGEEDPAHYYLTRMDEVGDDVFKGALIIVCDTANTSRISDKRFTLGDYLIKIDHHPNNDLYGDLSWVDTGASSTSEMIYELFKSDDSLKLTNEAARLIYAGIVGDTGRFLFPSTTNRTFNIASDLVDYSFDRSALYNDMYNTPIKIARMQGYVLENFTLSENGVSTIRLTKEILRKFDLTSLETGSLVGVLGHIEGIKAWVFFIEEENLIRVRIRSKEIVINKLAAKYNGGGHPLASGASIKTWKEADALTEDLEELCRIK